MKMARHVLGCFILGLVFIVLVLAGKSSILFKFLFHITLLFVMVNTLFVTDLKAIRNGWLLINSAHLPEQTSLSMLEHFSCSDGIF